MTLIVRPIRLNKSVYIRVPNDIADMIGLSEANQFTLRFQETDQESQLIYSIQKSENRMNSAILTVTNKNSETHKP